MANTFRTLSDLLGRYPDNSQGAISAQDLRDGVVSWHTMPNVVPVDSYGDSTDRTSRATAVQAAINDASAKGLGYVMVTEDFLNYDASAVTFDSSVRMVREGQAADVFDVKAYGAAGDGVEDDASAVQSAANAASSAEESVWAPAGTYVIGSSITWPSRTNLVGVNRTATTFQIDDSDLDFLSMTAVENAEFCRFQVDYGSASTGSQTGVAIRVIENSHHLLFSDLVLGDCFHGIHSNFMWMTRVENVRVNDSQNISFFFDGEQTDSSGAGTTLTVVNCYANRPGFHGFVFDSYQTAVGVSCAVDNMDGGGSPFRVQGTGSNVILLQPHGEENDVPDESAFFEVTGASAILTVVGGFSTGLESSGGTASYFEIDTSSGNGTLAAVGFRGASLGASGSVREHLSGGGNTAFFDFRMIEVATDSGSSQGATMTRVRRQDRQGLEGFFGATPVAQQSALTSEDGATVDGTYGSEEQGVIDNNRTRISEIESALQEYGLLA